MRKSHRSANHRCEPPPCAILRAKGDVVCGVLIFLVTSRSLPESVSEISSALWPSPVAIVGSDFWREIRIPDEWRCHHQRECANTMRENCANSWAGDECPVSDSSACRLSTLQHPETLVSGDRILTLFPRKQELRRPFLFWDNSLVSLQKLKSRQRSVRTSSLLRAVTLLE